MVQEQKSLVKNLEKQMVHDHQQIKQQLSGTF
jgi:hypothetical protein